MTDANGPTGVVGAGVMGRDIAALLATAGYDVTLLDVDEAALDDARTALETDAPEALAAAGFDPPADLGAAVTFTTDYDALVDATFVVEAVPERLDVKHAVMDALEDVLAADAVVGTNTSSLTPGDVADGMAHPERVVLFHFANPAIPRDIVEIAGDAATDDAIRTARAVGRAIGKEPVVLDRERRGNGLSRLSAAIKCAATWELTRSDPAALDAAASAVGFDRGPIELIDRIGVDVHLATVDNLAAEYGDRFAPPPDLRATMEEMVADGCRGMKDGEGFFAWDGDDPQVPDTDADADVTPVVAALVNEAHEMVADGVADRDRVDAILKRGSGGAVGPFDLEAMLGADTLRDVLQQRYEETGAGVFAPADSLGSPVRR
ncbi:3-hydroxyacyl-CoA dehydrogenase NAD-binding domain-containing protein [Halobacteriaceae archaeon GCM10025711]